MNVQSTWRASRGWYIANGRRGRRAPRYPPSPSSVCRSRAHHVPSTSAVAPSPPPQESAQQRHSQFGRAAVSPQPCTQAGPASTAPPLRPHLTFLSFALSPAQLRLFPVLLFKPFSFHFCLLRLFGPNQHHRCTITTHFQLLHPIAIPLPPLRIIRDPG